MEDSGSSPSGVTGEPVDTSGLSFTATYDDGTTGSVIPSSYTPTSFGDTVGTQTVTFSFTGTDITVDVDYDVEAASPVLTGISVSGTPTGLQYQGYKPDLTGLTVTASYEGGTTADITNSPDLTFTLLKDGDYVSLPYYGAPGTSQFVSTSGGPVPTIKIAYGGFETEAVEMPQIHFRSGVSYEFRVKDSETSSWDDADVVTDFDDYVSGITTGMTSSEIGTELEAQELSSRIYLVYPKADYATDMAKSAYTYSFMRNHVWDEEEETKIVDGITYTGAFMNEEFYTAGVKNVTWLINYEEEEQEFSVPITVEQGVQKTVTSISVTGLPTGTQQLDDWPDYTGLTFTYGFDDGTSLTKYGNDGVTDSGVALISESGSGLGSDGKWVDLSQTAVTLTVSDADSWWTNHGYLIASPAPSTTFDFNVPTVTSVTITGTGDMSAQTADDWPDYTGLTFTYGLSNGTTVVKQGNAGVYDDGLDVAIESGADLVDGKWLNPLPASSTVTITVADGSGTWWENHGYLVASPAPSTTVTFS